MKYAKKKTYSSPRRKYVKANQAKVGASKQAFKSRYRKKHHHHKKRYGRKGKGQPFKSQYRYSKQKFTMMKRIEVQTGALANQTFQIQLCQGNVNNVSATRSFNFGESHRFNEVKHDWEQYAITGVSVHYLPNMSDGMVVGQAGTDEIVQVLPAYLWLTTEQEDDQEHTTSTTDWPDDRVLALDAVKTKSAVKPFKLWFSNRARVAGRAAQGWPICADFDSEDAATQDTGLPYDALNIRFSSNNMPNEWARLGTLKVTYYITFRGQSSDSTPNGTYPSAEYLKSDP